MILQRLNHKGRLGRDLRTVHQLVERRQTSVSKSNIRCVRQLATASPFSTLAPSLLSSNDNHRSYWYRMVAATAAAGLASASAVAQLESVDDDTTVLLNWSGTHSVRVPNERYFEPETVEEVEAIVQECHKKGQPLRPIGAALSPNAVGFSSGGMIGLAGLDKILQVDIQNQTVTVQAGARVSQVVEALEPHGLTLPNLASIAEQQMGGFVQIGAHGTGRCIAPVDHYVTRLKIVTPGRGTIVLTPEDGEMFELAKVGLGCLGVVVEVTMQCIPAHRLVEHTFVLSYEQAKEQVDELLTKHKHMRYMWIPYADTVVVVTNDPEDTFGGDIPSIEMKSEDERFQPFRELLLQLHQEAQNEDEMVMEEKEPITMETIRGMGFGELRDACLAFNPLDVEHVKRCNKAEAEFWRRSEGYQVRPSHQLLQFDCGGQQWVFETCFPTGKQEANSGNDMKFMTQLLTDIEEEGIPAHSPIEQRWTASSSSLMSPASGSLDGLHSWVGIINYLPTEDENQRKEITDQFTGKYSDLMRTVGTVFGATSHWAKLEKPSSLWKLVDLRMHYESRLPIGKFNAARAFYDPKNIMTNDLLNLVFGTPK